MLQSSSPLLLPPNPPPLTSKPAIPRQIPATLRRKLTVPVASSLANRDARVAVSPSPPHLLRPSVSPSPVLSSSSRRNLGFRSSGPEFGLLLLLFVISMAVGSFFALAVVSLPTVNSFRRLGISVDKLSKVASEELPGTLSSLKLSGREINGLTQQLDNLRERISGSRYGKKERTNKPRSKGGRDDRIFI